MTVYVDAPIWKKSKTGRKSYSHMIADSLDELHEFAEKIGVKKHFFHKSTISHYDITSEQYQVAVDNGAKTVSSKELVKISKLSRR